MAVRHEAPPLRVGFLGAGAVAELHAMTMKTIDGMMLAGVYDPDEDVLRRRAEAWDVAPFRSAEALIRNPEIDAVFVLSPVPFHESQTLAVIAAGKPAFIEKPVSDNEASIRRIAEAARDAGVFAMPGHNYIHVPQLQSIRRNLDTGEFGTIHTMAISYSIHHAEALASHYPGILRQVIPHHLYTLLYLGFRPVRVTALTSSMHYRALDREDQVILLLQNEAGALSTAFASFATDDLSRDPWTFHIKILGSEGSASFSWRDATTRRQIGTHPQAYLPYEESYRNELLSFLEECRKPVSAAKPLSTLEDAACVEAIISATERAVTNRQVVEIAYTPKGSQ
jgi:predicted dehydrogenase